MTVPVLNLRKFDKKLHKVVLSIQTLHSTIFVLNLYPGIKREKSEDISFYFSV